MQIQCSVGRKSQKFVSKTAWPTIPLKHPIPITKQLNHHLPRKEGSPFLKPDGACVHSFGVVKPDPWTMVQDGGVRVGALTMIYKGSEPWSKVASFSPGAKTFPSQSASVGWVPRTRGSQAYGAN